MEKKKKEKSLSGCSNKAANSHVIVPTTATIKKVDDNTIAVSLCTAGKPRWMLDSGVMHHISPHRSDFTDYTPIKGTVHLGDKFRADQISVGTVIFKSPQGYKIMLKDVLHIPSVHTVHISYLQE